MDQVCEPKKASARSSNAKSDNSCHLILYKDSHSISYIVDCLVDVCKHEPEQAEQCVYLSRVKGSCKIASGTIDEMKIMFNKLKDRKLLVDLKFVDC